MECMQLTLRYSILTLGENLVYINITPVEKMYKDEQKVSLGMPKWTEVNLAPILSSPTGPMH